MTNIAATGFAIVLLAGLLEGLFALPMKFARGTLIIHALGVLAL